jgi:anion-transporting  ArsA/GET3 family ATPase
MSTLPPLINIFNSNSVLCGWMCPWHGGPDEYSSHEQVCPNRDRSINFFSNTTPYEVAAASNEHMVKNLKLMKQNLDGYISTILDNRITTLKKNAREELAILIKNHDATIARLQARNEKLEEKHRSLQLKHTALLAEAVQTEQSLQRVQKQYAELEKAADHKKADVTLQHQLKNAKRMIADLSVVNGCKKLRYTSIPPAVRIE